MSSPINTSISIPIINMDDVNTGVVVSSCVSGGDAAGGSSNQHPHSPAQLQSHPSTQHPLHQRQQQHGHHYQGLHPHQRSKQRNLLDVGRVGERKDDTTAHHGVTQMEMDDATQPPQPQSPLGERPSEHFIRELNHQRLRTMSWNDFSQMNDNVTYHWISSDSDRLSWDDLEAISYSVETNSYPTTAKGKSAKQEDRHTMNVVRLMSKLSWAPLKPSEGNHGNKSTLSRINLKHTPPPIERESKTKKSKQVQTEQVQEEKQPVAWGPFTSMPTAQMVIPRPAAFETHVTSSSFIGSLFKLTQHVSPISGKELMPWNEIEWRFVQERVGKPKVENILRVYNPRFSWIFNNQRRKFRALSDRELYHEPDLLNYASQLTPYEPSHPPSPSDALWSFFPASTDAIDGNNVLHVLNRSILLSHYQGYPCSVIPTSQVAESFLPRWSNGQLTHLWLCQVLCGSNPSYYNQNTFHDPHERKQDFDSLVASELNPSDPIYNEIVLMKPTQILPIYLVSVSG